MRRLTEDEAWEFLYYLYPAGTVEGDPEWAEEFLDALQVDYGFIERQVDLWKQYTANKV